MIVIRICLCRTLCKGTVVLVGGTVVRYVGQHRSGQLAAAAAERPLQQSAVVADGVRGTFLCLLAAAKFLKLSFKEYCLIGGITNKTRMLV